MSRRADRQRTYRRRASSGKIIVPVEIDEIEIDEVLIAGGFLDANAADDRRAIAVAIKRMIAMLGGRYA
jgi:hypothetical protein